MGGLSIPSFQRYSTRAVQSFHRNRSTLRILRRSLSPRGVAEAMRAAAVPRYQNLLTLSRPLDVPVGIVAMNVAASALWTVGVLASIYAGVIEPDFRVTSSALSSVINGVATILMFLLIDPYLSGLTDDAVQGRVEEARFRRVVVWLVVGRLAGTVLAQVLLVPAAHLIAVVARWL